MYPPHFIFRRLRTWLALFLFCAFLLFCYRSPPTTSGSPNAHPHAPPQTQTQHRIAVDTHPEFYSQFKKTSSSADGGVYEDEAALCRRHGWQAFKPHDDANRSSRGGKGKKGRRKIYDLSMINIELEWLEIRLNTTYDAVDHFVVVEAPRTFTGRPKDLVIKQNWDRFAPYHDKLVYHELEYPPGWNPPRAWDNEDLQRDAMLTQVFPRLEREPDKAPRLGDVVIVADVDEIPRPETLRVLRACAFPRRTTLRSRFYYYSFEFLHRGAEWPHPQATFYEGVAGTVRPTNLRNGDFPPFDGTPWGLVRLVLQPLQLWRDSADLWNAGWHCSSCYRTMAELLHKMGSVSHVWQNNEEFRGRDRIAERVRSGRDLWDRPEQVYDPVVNNTDLPPLLLSERERFKYLVDRRSGESAGFSDYPP